MIDFGVAIVWIAISVAGMKGLSAFITTVGLNSAEIDLGARAGEAPPSTETRSQRASIQLGHDFS
jgi:hypothetical protein